MQEQNDSNPFAGDIPAWMVDDDSPFPTPEMVCSICGAELQVDAEDGVSVVCPVHGGNWSPMFFQATLKPATETAGITAEVWRTSHTDETVFIKQDGVTVCSVEVNSEFPDGFIIVSGRRYVAVDTQSYL